MQNIMTIIKPVITVEVGDFGIKGIKTSKELIEYVIKYEYEPYVFDGKLVKHNLQDRYSYQNIILIPNKN